MFIGHFGLGFAGKRIAPTVSLGTLFLAVEFADGLWPVLLLAGVEHARIVPGLMRTSALDLYDYPWSHSLVALIVWGAILGAVYFAATRSFRGSWVMAAAVVSHWFLDACMHRPDMPPVRLGRWANFVKRARRLVSNCCAPQIVGRRPR